MNSNFPKRLRGLSGCLAIAVLIAIVLLLADWLAPLRIPSPDLSGSGSEHRGLRYTRDEKFYTRLVLDEQGRPLRAFADSAGAWRYPITQEQVSPFYIEALLQYEDRWFWYHPGVNPLALARAMWQNRRHGRVVSGGSTLTMQVARLLHPHSRTVSGKLMQVLRSLQLEWHFSKPEILQLYLNTAPFGGTIEGVAAACFTYLDKSCSDLTHAEAALMAVLPQAPSRLRPDRHPMQAQLARDKVLDRLVAQGVWSVEVVADAKLEPVISNHYRLPQLAPLLARRLLSPSNTSVHPKAVTSTTITTTIDGDLQLSLQDYLASYIEKMPERSSAAILVVDNASAEVKAYLGTADFASSTRFGHVDMVQAIRSPGSTLKPFLYGMALDDGLIHSQSLLADVPRSYGNYRPANFSNGFSGPVSASQALQRSLNIPAVDLLERLGTGTFVARLRNAGMVLKIPQQQPGLAVILGGAGVSLEQLVASYRALASNGKSAALRFRTDQRQQPLRERYLLSPASAWVIHNTLAQVDRPGAVNHASVRKHRTQFAWKTGTSHGFRDAWAIGVNRRYTIGVWIGRPDNTPQPGHYGRLTAGPLLFAVADRLAIDDASIDRPPNVEPVSSCWPLGTRYTDSRTLCHEKKQGYMINGNVPPTWHRRDAEDLLPYRYSYWKNSVNGLRVELSCIDPTENVQAGVPHSAVEMVDVALWPKVLDAWLVPAYRRNAQIPPVDPACGSVGFSSHGGVKIIGIEPDSIYRRAGVTTMVPSVSLAAIGGTGKLHWYVNGRALYPDSGRQPRNHALKNSGRQQIVVMDDSGQSDRVDIVVR